ncbi:MAG: ABC transporter permease [Mycoplasmoidaceae bacterium]
MNTYLNIDKNKVLLFLKKWYIHIIILIIYIPLVFIVLLSFTGQSDRENILNNFGQLTGENFINIFSNSDFLNAFFNSLFVALVVTPVSLILALFTVLGIWGSNKRAQNQLLNFTKFDIAIPDIITGVILSVLFTFTWISMGQNFGYITVVVSHISFCTPYAVMAMYPKMSKFQASLISASMDLGRSKWSTYFHVVLPYLKSSLLTAFVLVTTLSFDDFIITSLVNGNFETIGTVIFQSSKGIKAWIVTFGAIIVIGAITGTAIYISLKTFKNKREKKHEKN